MSRKLKKALFFAVVCLYTSSLSALAKHPHHPQHSNINHASSNRLNEQSQSSFPNNEHQDETFDVDEVSTSSNSPDIPQGQEVPTQPLQEQTHQPHAPNTVDQTPHKMEAHSETIHAANHDRDTGTLTDESAAQTESPPRSPVEQTDKDSRKDSVSPQDTSKTVEHGAPLDTRWEGQDAAQSSLPHGPQEAAGKWVGGRPTAKAHESDFPQSEQFPEEHDSHSTVPESSEERYSMQGQKSEQFEKVQKYDQPGDKMGETIRGDDVAGSESSRSPLLGEGDSGSSDELGEDRGDPSEVDPTEETEEKAEEPGEGIYSDGIQLILKPTFEERVRGYDLLQQAAEMGNSKAKAELAYGYLFGSTLEYNFTAAFEIFSGLAAQGHPAGQYGLGFMYSTGIGVSSNQAKAILYYTFSALGGDHYAQMAMGYRALMGISVVQSCETALSYYYKAAKKVASEASIISGGHAISKVRLMEEENEPNVYGISEDDMVHYHNVFADSGNTGAQLLLGVFYMYGMAGAERNFQMALKFLQQAADEGMPAANALIGKIYAEGGPNVPQDNKTAMKYFKKAADQKHPDGFTGVGMMYLYGMGVQQDYMKSLEQFTVAADKGSAEGQYFLGNMYLNGYGVRRDYSKAIRYFQLASHGGYLLAVYHLAEMHAEGTGVKRDCNYAVELFKSVAERGKWSKLFPEAQRLYSLEELDSALMIYLMLAEMGFEVAQTNAAYILEQEGYSIVADNETSKRALILWKRAAAQGYIQARVKLGDYYYYGQGTVVNYEAAASQYRIASDKQSSAQAMFNLGYMYEQGLGLEKDYHLAKRYYDMASDTSSNALVPVNLALLKLDIVSFYNTYREFFQTVELSSWFEKLDSALGEDWDIYLMSVLAGAVAALIIWRARRR